MNESIDRSILIWSFFPPLLFCVYATRCVGWGRLGSTFVRAYAYVPP
jgi:hypothetical protein